MTQPDIIYIKADDARLDDFDDTTAMPKLNNLIREHGIDFRKSFVPFPVCGPSRCCTLLGQEAHNHGVTQNGDAWSTLVAAGSTTVPRAFKNAGYNVAAIGKVANWNNEGIGVSILNKVLDGYAEWHVINQCSHRYTSFSMAEKKLTDTIAKTRIFGKNDYTTEIFNERVLDFIPRAVTAGQPYCLFYWPNAPHLDHLPSATWAGSYSAITQPQNPNFNEPSITFNLKPDEEQHNLLDANDIAGIQDVWRQRRECMRSVDDSIGDIVALLVSLGTISNTIIIVDSDNANLLGEHRIPAGKDSLYEEAINVGTVMRGPGIASNETRDQIITNVDITRWLLDVAGATPGLTQDGHSIDALLTAGANPSWRTAIGLQTRDSKGVRSTRYAYFEWDTGGRELYDMQLNPYQLGNSYADPNYAIPLGQLQTALATLKTCVGATCYWTDAFSPPS